MLLGAVYVLERALEEDAVDVVAVRRWMAVCAGENEKPACSIACPHSARFVMPRSFLDYTCR